MKFIGHAGRSKTRPAIAHTAHGADAVSERTGPLAAMERQIAGILDELSHSDCGQTDRGLTPPADQSVICNPQSAMEPSAMETDPAYYSAKKNAEQMERKLELEQLTHLQDWNEY